MPTYDYRCKACGHELEVFQKITEAPKKKCPACKKSQLERQIGGGAGFLFKGSGFYLTDYRSEGYKKAAAADGSAGSSSSESPGKKESGSKESGGKTGKKGKESSS
jgi:putative FmdB family regulatory protein